MRFQSLAQHLFLSTVRIESSTPEGTSVGTGFIFAYEEEDHLPEGYGTLFFLVTNKHVVENAEGGWFYFLGSSGSGTPALGHSVQIQAPSYTDAWYGHPSPDVDVAVLPLNQMIHYREEPNGPTVGEVISAAPIRSAHVPKTEHIEENLDAIEEIVFIGYPDGRYDTVNLTPIARKGITATPLQLDYAGRPTFLIDASVFRGSSGSPVFAAPNTIRSKALDEVSVVGSQLMLLGVLAGTALTTSEGKIEFAPIEPNEEEPDSPHNTLDMAVEVEQMIDLGHVFKSLTVLETIEDYIKKYLK